MLLVKHREELFQKVETHPPDLQETIKNIIDKAISTVDDEEMVNTWKKVFGIVRFVPFYVML